MGEAAWKLVPEVYQLIADYELPKLAKVCKIEPKHVIDYINLRPI